VRDGTSAAAGVWRVRTAGRSSFDMSVGDRIADVWGARTPFACGGDWPARETLTQITWLKTHVRVASPRALAVGGDS